MLSIFSLGDGNNYDATQAENLQAQKRKKKKERDKTMIEYEELRADIDRYLMERFKYRKSLVRLTADNIIATRRIAE